MAKEMMREIGNKSREFYEFVLPPVDMELENDRLKLQIDLPGFNKNDIKLTLHGNILSIQACKEVKDKHEKICNQRPNVIDKKLRLPIKVKEEGMVNSAKLVDGVLTVIIPIEKTGKDITIE